jgi:hypothetical protein
MKMNRKNLIKNFVIVILLIIVIILLIPKFLPEKAAEKEKTLPEIKLKELLETDKYSKTFAHTLYQRCTIRCEDEFFKGLADEFKLFELCKPIKEEYSRNECFDAQYLNVALQTRNQSMCSLIVQNGTRNGCVLGLQVALAVEKSDESLCEQSIDAGTCKQRFYFAMALKTLDKSWCYKMSEPEACLKALEGR